MESAPLVVHFAATVSQVHLTIGIDFPQSIALAIVVPERLVIGEGLTPI